MLSSSSKPGTRDVGRVTRQEIERGERQTSVAVCHDGSALLVYPDRRTLAGNHRIGQRTNIYTAHRQTDIERGHRQAAKENRYLSRCGTQRCHRRSGRRC
jgi:hypothetical protein